MNRRCGRFARCLSQRRSENKTLSWQQGDSRADQFRSRSSWCSGDLRWKLNLLLWPRDQETEFPVEAFWLSQTQEGQTEQTHPQTFDDPFFDNTGIQLEKASTFQIGSVAFPPGQCTSTQLHPCHRLFEQDGHQQSSSYLPNPSAPAGYDTRSIFKRSLAGLNSEVSFS